MYILEKLINSLVAPPFYKVFWMNVLDSPASTRLPYEILRKIIILAYTYIPRPQEPDEPELDLQLVSPPVIASHVCRSWRYGLLDDPLLWTCVLIPQFNPSGVIEILHRSRSVSLNVLLVLRLDYWAKRYDYDDTPEMLFSLFQQIHRFKLLHVQVNLMGYRSSPRYADFLQSSAQKVLSYLQQPAPKLQTFRFWYKGSFPLKETFPTLFSGEAPNIKHIHYAFSEDFQEIESPLFHNLSELSITLPATTIELDHILSLVELSPELKLLHVYSDWEENAEIFYLPDSLRKINLSHMEILVLEVNNTVELVDLIWECITFPQDLVWNITLDGRYITDDAQLDSPHLVELLSRTHFSSFRIQFDPDGFVNFIIEEENCGPQYLDQSGRNRFLLKYNSVDEFAIVWDTAASYIERSSRITHLYLALETKLESTVFPKILERMQNLESLTIRKRGRTGSDVDDPSLSYLSILTPNPENVTALEYNANVGATGTIDSDPVQDPDLDLVSMDEDMPFDLASSASAAILCPLLRELTIELSDSLDKAHTSVLRACSDSRRRGDVDVYPLDIVVHCPGMEEGVEFILGMGEDDSIHVSLVSH